MKEVETTVVRTTDGIPVRVEDTSSNWTLGFLILAAIALVIGGITMYNNGTSTTLRQQTVDLQQAALQQQQSETQRMQDMTAAQQAMNQIPKETTTNVVITDGLNGGAGPGSKTVVPPPAVQEIKTSAPAPAAPPAPATPPESIESTSVNP